MNPQDRCDLVLRFAQVLYVNGQSTDDTLAATERLSKSLGLNATIVPTWDDLHLEATEGITRSVSIVPGSPTGVHMERVASAMKTIDEVTASRLSPSDALQTAGAISHAPPAPTWLFAIAAAAGAAALAVLFGVQHIAAVMLIALSAAAGAVLRRSLAHYSANPFLQPLCAALLAGIIGALAVRYQLSSSLRLVAVCPCMILVPGPHVLNGMMDLSVARISLGASRLLYARSRRSGNFSRTPPRTGPARRLVTRWRTGEASAAVARHARRRSRRCGLRHIFLDALKYVGMAGCRRDDCSRIEVVDTFACWRRSHGRFRCLSRGGIDSYPSCLSSSYAIRRHRLCLSGFDDTGSLPLQDVQRPPRTCQ